MRHTGKITARLLNLLLLRDASLGLPCGRSLRLRTRARLPRQTAQSGRARNQAILLRRCVWGTRIAAPRTPAAHCCAVCLAKKPVGEPDAVAPHVRFDERGWETGRCRKARTTAPILDSTNSATSCPERTVRLLGL